MKIGEIPNIPSDGFCPFRNRCNDCAVGVALANKGTNGGPFDVKKVY